MRFCRYFICVCIYSTECLFIVSYFTLSLLSMTTAIAIAVITTVFTPAAIYAFMFITHPWFSGPLSPGT